MNHDDEIRAFVAIPLPKDVTEYLSEIISDLKLTFPDKSVKWVQPGNIHLTLKFLGNISKSTLHFLLEKLRTDNRFSTFNLTINKIGAFPSIYKPKVIWVGTSSHDTLSELAQFVEKSTSMVKNENDSKSFSPHLTIARLRPGVKKDQFDIIKQELYKRREINSISFSINYFCMYQSILTSEGPIYTELHKYNF
ncbi:MAG: RNA 2',3'-cyclic phosphodiesterase [Anaerolineaceae bacterium]|nr:RNA 2',3'-cyclic phosphodiesterase [Anaerolineaceae bacterium]